MADKSKVVFFSPIVPNYKTWLMEQLGARIKDFHLFHGQERQGTVPQDVPDPDVPNNHLVRVRYRMLGRLELTWIPSFFWTLRNKPDVIILNDQTRILSNYPLLFLARLMRKRIVYYTHGFNHQAKVTRGNTLARMTERLRLFCLRRADAIVVYNQRGKDHLQKIGIACLIYVSNNTIEIQPRLNFYRATDREKVRQEVRAKLGIPPDVFVISFLGRLVEIKRVDFFVRVLTQLKDIRAAHGLIIGNGPLEQQLAGEIKTLPIQMLGFQQSTDLGRLLIASDVVFIPGMVGLAVLEAFCSATPVLTVNHDFHSPEIEYLKDRHNGIVIPDFDINQATQACIELADNPQLLKTLGANALTTAETECDPSRMVDSFISAINTTSDSRSN